MIHQQLEPAFCTVQVFDRNGKRVDKGDPQVDHADGTQLVVSLPWLAPGTYGVTCGARLQTNAAFSRRLRSSDMKAKKVTK